MAKAPKKRVKHNPEARSVASKLFELAMGPGLMLAVLIALGIHLVINDQADALGVYAAQD